jgi:hypothetical protein
MGMETSSETSATNSVAFVRKRTISTQQPPHVREVSANILRIGVACSAQRIFTTIYLGFLDPEPLLFHSSSFTVILTNEAEWIPFQTHYFSEILMSPGIELGRLDL